MSKLLDLAELLEAAAKALRQADAELATVPKLQVGNAGIALTSAGASVRLRKGVMRAYNIRTLGELSALTFDQLVEVRNISATTANEARELLKRYGMSLLGELPPGEPA